MATVTAYWRPTSITEAVDLLDRPDTVLVGGGTTFNERVRPTSRSVAVVDLQAAGLAGIRRLDGHRLEVGATTTLQQVADDERVPSTIRHAAKRELPSTLRNQATVAGRVASADWESELLAALLAHETVLSVRRKEGAEEVALGDLLADRRRLDHRLITAATLATSGRGASERTARTVADRPIVAVVGRVTEHGVVVAASGVASVPIVVDALATLRPPADFRGSTEYRRAVAATLIARVTEALA